MPRGHMEVEHITKKKFLKILYIIATFGVIVFVGVLDPNVKDIGRTWAMLSPGWVLAAIGSMLVFWFSEAALLDYAVKFMHARQSFWRSLKISLIGQYYSALTPFASGGQPVQVVYMKKDGIPVGSSTSILVLKFILWQVAVCIFAAIALVVNDNRLLSIAPGLIAVIVFGMIANLLAVFAATLTMIQPKWISSIGHAFVRLFTKMRFVKHPDKQHASVDGLLGDFRSAMSMASRYKPKVVVLFLLTIMQMVGYFSVTYFLYRAFGLSEETLIKVIMLQSIVYVAVSFIPLPGASGASEGGFYLAFSYIFPGGTTYVAMLMWRVFTYYSNIIIGALIVLYDSLRVKKAEAPKSR